MAPRNNTPYLQRDGFHLLGLLIKQAGVATGGLN